MLLSICIPVYNNSKFFEICLYSAARAIIGFEDKVEIVISDNASEENIQHIVKCFQYHYDKIKCKYHRNQVNVGLALNFINAVEIAKGKFAWIIGSDDFVYPDGIKRIINVIESGNHVSFIGLNLAIVNLSSIEFCDYDPLVNNLFIDFPDLLTFNKLNYELSHPLIVDDLADPSFGTVMLGSMMASVFETKIWKQFNFSSLNVNKEFDNFESIYPHLIVFASKFLSKSASFIDDPVVLVGEGFRSWEDDNIFKGPLLFIYFNVFIEIFSLYRTNGLKKLILKNCKKYINYTHGFFFIDLLHFKMTSKTENDLRLKIKILKIIEFNFLQLNFYKGLIINILKRIIIIKNKSLI